MQTAMVFATITNNPESFPVMAGGWAMPGLADMAGALQQVMAEAVEQEWVMAVVQEWAMAVLFHRVRAVDWVPQKAGDADLVRVRVAELHPVADTLLMKTKTVSVMSTKKVFPNKI